MTPQRYLMAKVFLVRDEKGNESVDVEYAEPVSTKMVDLICDAWSKTHSLQIKEYDRRIREAKSG